MDGVEELDGLFVLAGFVFQNAPVQVDELDVGGIGIAVLVVGQFDGGVVTPLVEGRHGDVVTGHTLLFGRKRFVTKGQVILQIAHGGRVILGFKEGLAVLEQLGGTRVKRRGLGGQEGGLTQQADKQHKKDVFLHIGKSGVLQQDAKIVFFGESRSRARFF